MSLTIEQLDQILQTLWPKSNKLASSSTRTPELIKVKGHIYRRAETMADKLLALSVEMQDYDVSNLEGWTELANRMLSALDLGKDKIEVDGKEITAQQLYTTLERVLKQTQEKHRQVWHERDKAHKRHLDQYEPRSRNIPEFYRDPELKKPVMEAKPPVFKYDAQVKAPSEVTFRGAKYQLITASVVGYLSKGNEHHKMVFEDSMGYRERIYAAVMLSKVWDKPEWSTVAVSYSPHRDVVTLTSDTDKRSFKVTIEGTESLDYLKQHGFVLQHDL
jgi:hypothetical protein